MDVDKRHILMTTDTLGGVWNYSLSLTQALEPYDIHVHLACMGALPDKYQQAQAKSISNLTLYSSKWQLEWMDNPWEEVADAGNWLLYLQAEIQPDLIHLNNYAHGALPWQAPVLMVGHSCVLSWWQSVLGEAAPKQYHTYRQQVKKGLQAADVVVAPTAAFLNELQHYYGPFQQQAVIYNGMEANAVPPGNKEPFIMACGRLWDQAKNIAFCDAIAAQGLDWPIVVAGEEKHPNGAQAKFPHLNTVGKLSHTGVAQRLSEAGIYLLPAKYEPFGLSILEAANAGCALVLGDIPTLRELWSDAALFISNTDEAAAYQQLHDLLHDKQRRQELGQKAQERAKKYTLEKQGNAYYKLYQHLLEPQTSRAVLPAKANAHTKQRTYSNL